MAEANGGKLGVLALAALVVSAMIGGGIFSLPQNMAQGASADAVMISWVITGIGIFFLANTFRILSMAKPEATAGIYAYAKLGFGRFAGFQMAWGYWLCNVFGNVGYAVLLMDAMNYFFPGVFTGGNNGWSILGGSIVIWVMCFMVMRGIRQAASVNVIGTIAKLMPIALFIIVMLFVFRWATFRLGLSDAETAEAVKQAPKLGSMMTQVKSTMLVTLWAFIGIEGAVVVSGQAKSQKAVGKATILGFLVCLAIYVLLSVLPFGYVAQANLAKLANPSTALLLTEVVGKWGGIVMNLGVILALLTSWLAFTIMIAQIPYEAAKDGNFPKIFAHENMLGTPDVSLWVTSAIMQLAMIFVYYANNAWNTMLSITAVMILPPYLASTAYLWKLCAKDEYPKQLVTGKHFACLCGVLGSLYALWMIYAAGLTYLAMAFWFQALGIIVYCWACHDREKANTDPIKTPWFTRMELYSAILIALIALLALGWQLDQKTAIHKTFHKWAQEIKADLPEL